MKRITMAIGTLAVGVGLVCAAAELRRAEIKAMLEHYDVWEKPGRPQS